MDDHKSDVVDAMQCAMSLLSQANGHDDDYNATQHTDVGVAITTVMHTPCPCLPPWLPTNPGEQLCNLVGRWRILQRVGSHRWTTDDLVTAYVAATSTFGASQKNYVANNIMDNTNDVVEARTIRYLDLGTGNASVLQMVTWYLLSTLRRDRYDNVEAVGVEARSEAVGLARRSLSFNLGQVEYHGTVYGSTMPSTDFCQLDYNVKVVHGDFRDLVSLSSRVDDDDNACPSFSSDDALTMECIAMNRYDLITGTPPYFRVGFTPPTDDHHHRRRRGVCCCDIHDEGMTPSSAIIQQGGMPTSMQSAPARCEFRGGVEAYCITASALLQPHGTFVVCENWFNNDRVWAGAKDAGLIIECVWPVRGGIRKETNLFAVYVMKKKNDDGNSDIDEQQQEVMTTIRPPLVVRDKDGKWTNEYAKVLDAMSIPVI